MQLPGALTWFVPRLEVVEGPWTPAPDFDPYLVGVVDRMPDAPHGASSVRIRGASERPPAPIRALADGPPNTALLVGVDPARIVVDVYAVAAGWIALSSAYDPAGGWTARVSTWELWDGPDRTSTRVTWDEPVFAINRSILGAAVPPGLSRIEWTYRPRSVTLGAWLTLLGLVGLVGLLGETRWQRWRERLRARRTSPRVR